MALPPPRPKQKPAVPARPNSDVNVDEFQVNPLFTSEDEMKQWLDKNFEGSKYEVIETWAVSMIACRVRVNKFPKGVLVTIKKPIKRK